jgi:hypothetical protein
VTRAQDVRGRPTPSRRHRCYVPHGSETRRRELARACTHKSAIVRFPWQCRHGPDRPGTTADDPLRTFMLGHTIHALLSKMPQRRV